MAVEVISLKEITKFQSRAEEFFFQSNGTKKC